jgi:hypothetical protein
MKAISNENTAKWGTGSSVVYPHVFVYITVSSGNTAIRNTWGFFLARPLWPVPSCSVRDLRRPGQLFVHCWDREHSFSIFHPLSFKVFLV